MTGAEQHTSRQQELTRLYRDAFPAVARYIARTGGTFEEARDIFQDALIAYYEKGRDTNALPPKNEKAYLLGMARNLWHKKLERHNSRHVRTVPETMQEEENEISTSRLLRFVARSGKKCMELLQAVYYEKQPMLSIAQQFGFSGERSATVQKHKCLEKVRDSIKERSLTYEDFYE